MLKNDNFFANYTNLLFNLIYLNFAYICFDQDKKSTLETQKQANFIISDQSFSETLKTKKEFVKGIYIEGEKKY